MRTTDFLQAVERSAAAHHMLPDQGLVLCAVSGGMDSMVLLHVLRALESNMGFQLAAAHYNHKLRGEESQRDADFVAHWCRSWNIPLHSGAGDVLKAAKATGRSIEDSARSLRYDFLEETARQMGAVRIATAHHADDNLETLLLHLTRGTGLRGLSGIPPVRGRIIRPLLECSREEVADYARSCDIPHVEDSSNADPRHRRNFLRLEVLPQLKEMNPALVEGSVSTLRSLREDQALLMELAQARLAALDEREGALRLPAKAIGQEREPIAVRMLQLMLARLDAPQPQRRQLEALLQLCRGSQPSGEVCLPGGVLAQREYELLILCRAEEAEEMEQVPLCLSGITEPPGALWRLHCKEVRCPAKAAEGTFYLSMQSIEPPLMLRPRQEGDRLALPGRREKSLKKLMIEEKIPRRHRGRIPVLADKRGLVAVAGLGLHRMHGASPGEETLALHFEQIERERNE